MLSRTLRAARPAAQASRLVFQRTYMKPTAVRSADFVQQLYLKEISGYKPTPVKASDSEGHVSKFSIPQPPKSPEEDISSQLSSYESQSVDVEGGASSESGGAAPVEEDWFEEEEAEEAAAAH